MGRSVEFPRRTRAFGVDYKYTGQTQRSLPMNEAPPFVTEVVRTLQSVPGLGIHNAALLNWYDAKNKEYMGAHSDDETELVRHQPVVSMSWCTAGHYRRFRFSPKKGVEDALLPSFSPTWGPGVLQLRNGCLVVMGGQCQATHKHEVMKPTKAIGECEGLRINLTLRAFKAAPALSSQKRQREDAIYHSGASASVPSTKDVRPPPSRQGTLVQSLVGARAPPAQSPVPGEQDSSVSASAAATTSSDAALAQLVEMGFAASDAADALQRGGGSAETAIQLLLGGAQRDAE